MNKDDFAREAFFQKVAQEGARIGVIKAKRAGLPLLRPTGENFTYKSYNMIRNIFNDFETILVHGNKDKPIYTAIRPSSEI